jgi:hypothetical protein
MEPKQTNGQTGKSAEPVISDKQLKRMWAIARGSGWADEQVKNYLKGLGIEYSTSVPVSRYDAICERFKSPLSTQKSPEEEL